ncbi:MAG: flagellar basal body rod protein FlgC, partial [Nitrospinae bacterium]|nr:flagellar basal body rod protein FlgC [Nitrospinota bacterium]
MDLITALNISASGLSAQRLRMNVISGNLANINTTRTIEGGPYRRRDVVFAPASVLTTFRDIFQS